MRVFAILLVGLLIFSIASTSLSYAAPSKIEYRIPTVLSWLYRYVMPYAGIFPVFIELQPIDGRGDESKVGGDADDYANGRGGEIGEGSKKDKLQSGGISPLGPKDQNKEILKPSGLR